MNVERIAAIEIAVEHGWAIFPLRGKEPLTAHGFKDASSDPAQWAKWRAEFPDCNWGVPTGARNGFDVFDGDTLEGVRWIEEHILMGPRIRTAKGIHAYVRHLPGRRNATRLVDGVDVRGEGGYVVMAGSRHPTGVMYQWVPGTEHMSLPSFTFTAAAARRPSSHHVVPATGELIRSGQRNDTLFRLGCSVASKGGDYEQAVNAANIGRCQPPLDREEVNAILCSVEGYFRKAPDPDPAGYIRAGGAAEATRLSCAQRPLKAHPNGDGTWDAVSFHINCGVAPCPLCYRAWAWNESEAIMARFSKLGIEPHHLILKIPDPSWASAQEAIAAERGRIGGCVAALHAGWNSGACGEARGPHAHLWGGADPLEPGGREDAGAYTFLWGPEGETRQILDEVLKAALVQIRTSRSGIGGTPETGSTKYGHAVKWLGDLSYNKAKGSGKAIVRQRRKEDPMVACKVCLKQVPKGEWRNCTLSAGRELPDGMGTVDSSALILDLPMDRTDWHAPFRVKMEGQS